VNRTRIKVCGITSVDEARMVIDAGVDAIGMIFAESERKVSLETAKAIALSTPAWVTLVGVFTIPQFSGSEMPEYCERATSVFGRYLKVFHIDPALDYLPEDFAELDAYEHATFMFDTRVGNKAGGTGVPFDWGVVKGLNRPAIVAGGLTPENVGACVRHVRPFGVDVRSGVETNGVKDEAKVRAFVRAVREADAEA